LGGNHKKMSQERRIIGVSIFEGRQVLAGKHQQVDRGLRVNIFDSHGAVVLVNDFGGGFAVDNSAEEAIRH
jgi:hypothetical protein